MDISAELRQKELTTVIYQILHVWDGNKENYNQNDYSSQQKKIEIVTLQKDQKDWLETEN
jgi:hypothetical protein